PQAAPQPEYILVAQEHVAAGLEIVLLADSLHQRGFGDLGAMIAMNEGDIVDNEDTRLFQPLQLLHDEGRALGAIGPAIESPGTAKGAVPGTAAGKFYRGARIERTDEIAPAVAQEIVSGAQVVEIVHEARRRAL